MRQKAVSYTHLMITAENICDQWGLTREELDEFAAISQQKAVAAQESGAFDDEIVPVPVKVKKETVMITKDEGPRPGTTKETLAKLKCCSGCLLYTSNIGKNQCILLKE